MVFIRKIKFYQNILIFRFASEEIHESFNHKRFLSCRVSKLSFNYTLWNKIDLNQYNVLPGDRTTLSTFMFNNIHLYRRPEDKVQIMIFAV